LFAIPAQAQQTLQRLHDHLPAAVTQGTAMRVGALTRTEHLHLAIQLPLRHEDELKDFLQRLYDPHSSDFRKYLTVEEFTEKYGPSKEDFAAVVGYVKSHGMKVMDTPRNRMLVEVDATTPQAEAAFHVSMLKYQHPTEKRTFYAPDHEPSIELSAPILHISGLSDYNKPHPRTTLNKTAVAKNSTILNESAAYPPAPTGTGPYNSYLASDMRGMYYGGSTLTGAGQCVGLLEFDGYDVSDLNLYFSSVGKTNSVPVNNVLLGGLTAPMSDGGNDAEPILDIVVPIGMAPGLSQVRNYQCCSNSYSGSPSGIVVILNSMATENLCKQLSASYGYGNEASTDDPIYEEMVAQGQSFFAATGDYGPPQSPGNTSTDDFYPADNEYVTAVGMSLAFSSSAGGSWASEIYANGDAGGYSDGATPVALPSWQSGFANGGNQASSTYRNVPDVVMPGYGFYLCGMAQCYPNSSCTTCTNGGSSFASPMWAGWTALANQQAVSEGKSTLGYLNPVLYTIGKSANYGSDFHDIIGGTDKCCGAPEYYVATAGYDLVGGLGSPNGTAMMNDLITPPSTCSATTIVPKMQVGTGSWQNTNSLNVTLGSVVNLSPQPTSGGSWYWTGPAGYMATSRQINTIPLASGTNTYMATYVNAGGCQSTASFTIKATGTVITPEMQVGTGKLTKESSVTVSSTSIVVNLEPLPSSGGSWSWYSPNYVMSSTARIQSSVPLNETGYNYFWAKYTNPSGVPILQEFSVFVQ
jgi:subtilase family serine protease